MICNSHMLGASMVLSPDEELSPSGSPEENRVATPAKRALRRGMKSYLSTCIPGLLHASRLTTYPLRIKTICRMVTLWVVQEAIEEKTQVQASMGRKA